MRAPSLSAVPVLLLALTLLTLEAAAQNAAIPGARPAPGSNNAQNTAPRAGAPAAAPAPAAKAADTPPAATPPKAGDAKAPAADAKAPAPPATPAPKADVPAAAAATPEAPTEPETPSKKKGREPPPCVVADFRAIGIDVQDAEERRRRALAWIRQRGKQCSAQQLLVMRNNRAQWMGTADSGAVAAAIDSLLEKFAETNPDIAILLYGTPPPPPPPDDKNKKPEKK